MKNNFSNDANIPDIPLKQKVLGKDIIHAPQPALTPANGGTLSGGGSTDLRPGDNNVIANAVTRINQIEAALIKLGLIKHP